MNVLRQELRLIVPVALVGTVAMGLIAALYLSIYPSFHQDANDFMKFIAHLPPAVRQGVNMQVTSILSFLGFYAFTFTMLGLAAAVQATSVGLAIFGREDTSGTMDFLLSKPRARWSIFAQKYLAGVMSLVVSSLIFTGLVYALARWVDAGDIDTGHFVAMNVTLLAAQLWLYHFAAMLTQLRRIKSAIGASLGVSFTFFSIGVVGAIIGDEKFRYASPLKFFDVNSIASGGTVELQFVVYAVITAALLLGVTYAIYVRRDIKAVV